MEYKTFTKDLRKLFLEMTPYYIGTAHQQAGDKVRLKEDGSTVGNLDLYAMDRLKELIRKHSPMAFAIGEEDKNIEERVREILANQDQEQWSVDGLDGTGNRRLRSHLYGAMIAMRKGENLEYAAIYRPVDQRLYGNGFFYARRGEGAWQWCDEHDEYHRLHTAAHGELERIWVMYEGSSKKFARPEFMRITAKEATRPSWATCMATTTVVMGLASAVVAENPIWDVWPCWLFIQEAGGIVTDWDGNPLMPENCKQIVAAANPTDHKHVLDLMHEKQEQTA